MKLFSLIRWPNLVIVGLTQALLYYCLLVPAFSAASISPALDTFHFFLLICSTILIAAGGYIINDILDYPIDIVNKPERVIVHQHISIEASWNWYYASIGIGLLLSLYLANYVRNLPLVLLFPGAVFLLYWYSRLWKKQVLIGNIVVALFCMFVAGIVLFAERHSFVQLMEQAPQIAQQTGGTFLAYALFAFLSTMFREIVKDAEDVLGDQNSQCQTLPIVHGLPRAKNIAAAFGILLLLAVFYWTYLQFVQNRWREVAYLLIAIIIPVKAALFLLGHAQSKKQFHQLSQFAKYIMLSGILYLFFIEN